MGQMMTEKELLDLKRDIEQAKRDVAELQGQLKAFTKQLKDDWSCNNVEEAEKLLQKKDHELSKLTAKIESSIKELEEKYYE